MPQVILKNLRLRVDLHRRATDELIEDMCKTAISLKESGHTDHAKQVEQACLRIQEADTAFDDADTCLF